MLCDSIEYETFLVKYAHIAALYPNPSHGCNGDTLSPSLPFSMGSETVEPVSGLLLDLGDYSRVMFSTLRHIFLVERFVNTLQVISASAPLQWVQLGGLASATWPN